MMYSRERPLREALEMMNRFFNIPAINELVPRAAAGHREFIV
jgi:hypothetical protein